MLFWGSGVPDGPDSASPDVGLREGSGLSLGLSHPSEECTSSLRFLAALVEAREHRAGVLKFTQTPDGQSRYSSTK